MCKAKAEPCNFLSLVGATATGTYVQTLAPSQRLHKPRRPANLPATRCLTTCGDAEPLFEQLAQQSVNETSANVTRQTTADLSEGQHE